MKKRIRPNTIQALVIVFYVITVVLCIQVAVRYSGDNRYYLRSGAFSIQLPGEWATIPLSSKGNDFSIFPKLLPDTLGDQLFLASAHWKYYEDNPVLVSVRQIPKDRVKALIGKGGLKEFWQYLQNYQLSSPISPVLEPICNEKPDYVQSDTADISDLSSFYAILKAIGGSIQSNPHVTETRSYTYSDLFGPYVIQVSAVETPNYFYIIVANGESDFMDISPDTLKKALTTISP